MAINENRADSFLRMIRLSERGKLKIYLGYCAGVGKTYQMLLEAHRLKKEGVDVVVGLVETHQRQDTAALLEGLEIIPRTKILYHGIEVEEMDVEAVFNRKPAVALVDELAHANIPGSKNAKRYQDVEDLLQAGIHVISTLNVQHLESLYDTVEKDLNVKVKERIPDKVLLEADQLINVDLTAEDLRKRLEEGKVYPPNRINAAMEQFFKQSNLEELRELTLRELAAQIDSRRRDNLAADSLTPSSPDQIMVCLSSHGPNRDMLLRYASRLAGRLNHSWYAFYVQTPAESPAAIDAGTQRILSSTLTLAKQLGAMVFTYKGEDIVKTILQFAKEYRVGHIVVGAPGRKISMLGRLIGQTSVVERLIRESSGITLTVLDTKQSHQKDEAIIAKSENEISIAKILPRKDLQFANLMPETRICFWETPVNKEDAVNALIDLSMPALSGFQRNTIRDAVAKREEQGSTFLNEGVAFPHTRVAGLANPVLAMGIARKGIAGLESGFVPYFVFLILSPADMNAQHVQILSGLSRLSMDSFVMPRLKSAGNPEQINEVFKEWDALPAAKGKKAAQK
jgi:two-component system sensor histidine kinase KdpD